MADYPETVEVAEDECVDCLLEKDIASQSELEKRYPQPQKPAPGKSLRTLDRQLDIIKATKSPASAEAL